MKAHLVYYSRCGRAQRLALDLAAELGCGASEIHCARYRGLFGGWRLVADAVRGWLPEVTVEPPIGAADALIVVGPVWYGRLSAPLRSFLSHSASLPPILGVLATRARIGSNVLLEDDLTGIAATDLPALQTVTMAEIDRKGANPKVHAFLERVRPALSRRTVPVIVPRQVGLSHTLH